MSVEGGVFISYRREEASGIAGRIYDRIADRFGERRIFMDVDSIEPGLDFAEVIARAVGGCDVLLAVIGLRWLTSTDSHGRRRLDDSDDLVRLELESALARDIRVIPILVDGAKMPGRADLPDSLAPLTRRNALPLRNETFRIDIRRLEGVLEPLVRATPTPSGTGSDQNHRPAQPAGGSTPATQHTDEHPPDTGPDAGPALPNPAGTTPATQHTDERIAEQKRLWGVLFLVIVGGVMTGIAPFMAKTLSTGNYYPDVPWKRADGFAGYLTLILPSLLILFAGMALRWLRLGYISLGVICGATLINVVLFAEILINVLSNSALSLGIGSWIHLAGTLLAGLGISLSLSVASRELGSVISVKRDAWTAGGIVLVVAGLVGALLDAAHFQYWPAQRWVWAYPIVLTLIAVPVALFRFGLRGTSLPEDLADRGRRSPMSVGAVTTVATYILLGSVLVLGRLIGRWLDLGLTAAFCWFMVLSGTAVLAGCILSQFGPWPHNTSPDFSRH